MGRPGSHRALQFKTVRGAAIVTADRDLQTAHVSQSWDIPRQSDGATSAHSSSTGARPLRVPTLPSSTTGAEGINSGSPGRGAGLSVPVVNPTGLAQAFEQAGVGRATSANEPGANHGAEVREADGHVGVRNPIFRVASMPPGREQEGNSAVLSSTTDIQEAGSPVWAREPLEAAVRGDLSGTGTAENQGGLHQAVPDAAVSRSPGAPPAGVAVSSYLENTLSACV